MFLLLRWREATQSARTWHDYPWPWVSLTWLLCHLQLWRHGRWLRKFTVRFRPIRQELESSMYNNNTNLSRLIWTTSMFNLLSSEGRKMDHLLHETDGSRRMANQIVRQVFRQPSCKQEKVITGAKVKFPGHCAMRSLWYYTMLQKG